MEGARMSAPNMISPEKLIRLIGTPAMPVIVDVRIDDDFNADPRLLPASQRRNFKSAPDWSKNFNGQTIVTVCQQGAKLSHGTAAWLRHHGADAMVLEGGFEAWAGSKYPLVPSAKIPERDQEGRTIWVTRARPKIDRIACPWLIRRFVDPNAVFLFVAPSEVSLVADRFQATAFDIENVFWSHRGELCSFDTMIVEFGLETEPLKRLATIIRGADTARLDLAKEAPGLLAASLGLSRMFADDLKQLEAGILLYDAFYRWCRDAADETHNWPVNRP
jgi:rhodanese-related sulfurtransferase